MIKFKAVECRYVSIKSFLGVIELHGGDRLMLQGVQDTYDTYPMNEKSDDHRTLLVLIGKNLNDQLLQSDFTKILSSANAVV